MLNNTTSPCLQGQKAALRKVKEMAFERSVNLSLCCTMQRGTRMLKLAQVSKSLRQPSGRLVNLAGKQPNTVPQIININIAQMKSQKTQDINDKLIL